MPNRDERRMALQDELGAVHNEDDDVAIETRPDDRSAQKLIRRLDVRMSTPDIGDDGYVYPAARLLVDGQDLLADAGRWLTAWPARQILTGGFPLLPAEPPRRVLLYVQSPDPGGLAATIITDGDFVIWSDFQNVWEVGDDPLDCGQEGHWSAAKVPHLVFDAAQYTAEVQRATAARDWESDGWTTAVLLHHELYERVPRDPWNRNERDMWNLWNPGFAEPDPQDPARFLVTLWDDSELDVIVVALTAGSGTPKQKARAMAHHPGRPLADHPPFPSLSLESGRDRGRGTADHHQGGRCF